MDYCVVDQWNYARSLCFSHVFIGLCHMALGFGGLPKRSNGTDCKSVGYAFAGSNPAPPTASSCFFVRRNYWRRIGINGRNGYFGPFSQLEVADLVSVRENVR